jgi:H/ACA ribonucleoprotein complex non-core subunit NAF1
VHPEVKLPAVAEVGRNEVLDEVGEIMNVISDVVVVVGNQPGDDRVLDEGTLLVFDDRKVLGHVSTSLALTLPKY